jgi:hypothetical protein
MSSEPDRRTFLARLGLLGAVACNSMVIPEAVCAGGVGTRQSRAGVLLRPLVADVTRCTFSGLAAFLVPGRDAYSRAQGTPRLEPGAVAAAAPGAMMNMFDHLMALPDGMARGLAGALANRLARTPVPLPGNLPPVSEGVVETLDGAVRAMLTGPETLPLSQLVAMLLNVMATQVSPPSAAGRFLSPFARLSFGEKTAVFGLLEDPPPELVAAVADEVPLPLQEATGGLLPYLTGELLAFGPVRGRQVLGS